MATQISEYRFSSYDLPIATIGQRVAEIADRFGFKIDRWEEDGLGPAQGMFVRSAAGKVMLLCEMERAVRRLGQKGPTIYVEAYDLADLGVGPLVQDALETFGLSMDQLTWIAPEENRELALKMKRQFDERQRGLPSQNGGM